MTPALVWTLSALIGASVAAWNLVEAWQALQALGAVSNGRRILARGHVRREAIRVVLQGVWALIGISVLIVTGNASSSWTPISAALVGTNVLCTVQTLLDRRERAFLQRMQKVTHPND